MLYVANEPAHNARVPASLSVYSSLPPICRAASVLCFVAGGVLDVLLLRRWLRRQSCRTMRSNAEELTRRPWRVSDAAALLAVFLMVSVPAIWAALAARAARTAPISPGGAVVQILAIHAVLLTGVGAAAWRTGVGWQGALGLERGRWFPSARAGLLYGLACVPPALLVAGAVQALLAHWHIAWRQQAVFDWLADPRLPAAVKIALAAAAVLLAPLAEEAVFRGVLLPVLLRRGGLGWALAVTSLLFAALHLNALAFAPLALLGLCFAGGMLATGSVLTPMIMHALFNAEMLLLFAAFPEWAGARAP